MATIKEIAQHLGLSTTTVSNVIHGKTGEVSPKTIRRVQAFLEDVGYVPNINARNLAQGQSKIIGVVLKTQNYADGNILSDPFISELVGGIEAAVRKEGFFMMPYISDDIAEILDNVVTWNVDGLILFSMLDDDGMRVREKYHKPLVGVDIYSGRKLKNIPNVGLDDEGGAYEAVSYLIRCGHSKIGFFTNNRVNVDYQRFRGYRRALREAGIEYSDHNFFLYRPEQEEYERSLEHICREIIANKYTAVFCCSDVFAMTLISALYDRGIRVPDDVSVVGFDDNLYARFYRPGLTTMHQEIRYKGELAAKMIIEIIRGNEPENPHIVLKPSLLVRDTVKVLR